ncbi:hypothetical protein MVES1_000312 [Malassezia vespertilionis]|uniref:G-patch domain-containing protein n=1 Tax=Malassezia vespertilionis TaxID=2020962 RepID=A0A2N1JH02_9BASI|nr:uncharacterized protein MVES1_000312 [Malassezia vespertilionis]PKI85823.1 hypothetical protein MVES_000293 [Malassezia vespertilionis]WFD04987.1 hypothetical protein MVES1_000312 [Malassezia vespertilionis]
MARRKSQFLDEGQDSGDSEASDDLERAVPRFVQGTQSKAFPAFVRASKAPADAPSEGSASDEERVSFARRAPGGGLGAGRGAAGGAAAGAVPPAPLSRTSGSGGFDPSAYLRKMGWTGGGLGKEGEGIVNPIEVQLRPNRAGVAFGGRTEKTKQARREERRKTGAPSSSDEDTHAPTRTAPRSNAWKKRNEARPKLVHRTYDEIIAEAAGAAPSAGPIYDATGGALREVASVSAALRHAVPTEDTYLPELQHNTRLLCDTTRTSLDKMAQQGAGFVDRARWLRHEKETCARRIAHAQHEKALLVSVLDRVKQLAHVASSASTLEALQPAMDDLLKAQTPEMQSLHLDEAVAGALAAVLRRALATWAPLEAPHAFTALLTRWLTALVRDEKGPLVMTPYESMLWNVWMPTIRNALTNEWDVHDPAPAIALVEAWRPLVPAFLYDNIWDQLILPKLQRAVHAWAPTKATVPLHMLVVPWLPLAGARLDAILADARRQWQRVLATWPIHTAPAALLHWKGVFAARDWDALLLQHIVPRLSHLLRTSFSVNPVAQDMSALESVLSWHGIVRESVLSRLLETEFGTPFLHTLHQWLTQDTVQFDQVAAWYAFWRAWFPAHVARLEGVENVFSRALQLMNAALDAGERRTSLPMVSTLPTPREKKPPPRPAALEAPPTLEEISFRSIVEERAGQKDVFILPQNRLEPATGLPLLRAAKHIDGKHGIMFYLDDDVIFAADKGAYEPIALAEFLDRACAV